MRKIYLDVETTGLDRRMHDLTIVGAYDGKEVRQLISGVNLDHESLQELFRGVEEVVTFNGEVFDVPFITHKFPELELDFLRHKDLMKLGWKLGWRGGLKAIEKELGICRENDINGADAVYLWEEYKDGSLRSLTKLLDYNREDVVNLRKIERIVNSRLRL